MPRSNKSPLRARIGASLGGLVLSFSGGFLCSELHTPLPWMIGPLLSVATARLFSVNVTRPIGGRQTGQLLIGCTLGLYFTPVVASTFQEHAFIMLFGALLSIFVGYICAFTLSALSGVDRRTAFFASVPGGATEMSVLAHRYGGTTEKVALAQSLRVLFVVIIIPTVLTLSGAHGADQYQPSPGDVSYSGLVWLLLIGVVAAGVFSILRVPNGWTLGPLFATIAITVTENSLSAMPKELSNLGQLLIGCSLGSRFGSTFLRESPLYLFGVVVTNALSLLLAALIAIGLGYFGKIPIPTMILATAPGGIGEMGITAKVLQLGVPLVTAFHLTRVILIVATTAPLFEIAQRTAGKIRRKASVTEQ